MECPPAARTRRSTDLARRRLLLFGLPTELLVCVVEFLGPRDYAALVLANARLYPATRAHSPRLQDPVFAVAIWLATSRTARVDERLLRKYALDGRASSAGVSAMAALSQFVPRIEVSMPNGKELWSLVNGDVSITLRITTSTHDLGWDRAHFEGGAGAERMVRLVQADGHEFLCDGEKVVQVNFPDGRTRSFEYVGQ